MFQGHNEGITKEHVNEDMSIAIIHDMEIGIKAELNGNKREVE